ncbi:MAG: type II toxin-antitoxin system HicB family antitoxin [Planctomycetaceae bacterium]
MVTYRAAYFFADDADNGWVSCQVVDFPAAISQGRGLEDARRMLASALMDMAETYILQGDPLPIPDSSLSKPDADLHEPIHLVLEASAHVCVVIDRVGA